MNSLYQTYRGLIRKPDTRLEHAMVGEEHVYSPGDCLSPCVHPRNLTFNYMSIRFGICSNGLDSKSEIVKNLG